MQAACSMSRERPSRHSSVTLQARPRDLARLPSYRIAGLLATELLPGMQLPQRAISSLRASPLCVGLQLQSRTHSNQTARNGHSAR